MSLFQATTTSSSTTLLFFCHPMCCFLKATFDHSQFLTIGCSKSGICEVLHIAGSFNLGTTILFALTFHMRLILVSSRLRKGAASPLSGSILAVKNHTNCFCSLLLRRPFLIERWRDSQNSMSRTVFSNRISESVESFLSFVAGGGRQFLRWFEDL